MEVMGRHCGYLALMAGIAGGAEVIALPEAEVDPETVAQELRAAYDRGKSHAIAVVSEGAKYDADAHAPAFRRASRAARVRSAGDEARAYAARRRPGRVRPDARYAVRGRARWMRPSSGATGVLIGMRDGKPACTPLEQVAGRTRPADKRLLEIARLLAM